MKIIPYLLCLFLSLSGNAADEPQMETYTFVYILTGPTADLDQDAQSKAFAGHFANMKRMAEEGDLLLAGPYGAPKTDENLRGLWIFNTDQTEKALELARTDPTGKLGVFVFDAIQMKTDDPLLELPRLEKEDREQRLADPDLPDQWVGRGYIIATAITAESSDVKRVPGVLILGTLVGLENTRIAEDHTLVLLEAATPQEAKDILIAAGCEPEQWTMDTWYSNATHTQLPSLRVQSDD